MRGDSDLVGIPVVLGTIIAILAVFAAFFFIGPVVGIVLLIAAVALGALIVVRVIRENEIE
jgi:hypothetical protein